jgi:chromosomal replication initiation ATPase DnaA
MTRLMPFAGSPVLHPEDRERARRISSREPPAAAWRVAEEWCEAVGYTMEQMRGPDRTAAIAEARQALMWILRNRLGMSYPAIAATLNRDHSTVMHGVRREALRRGLPARR